MIILSANKSNDNPIACINLMNCIHYLEQRQNSMIRHGAGAYGFQEKKLTEI